MKAVLRSALIGTAVALLAALPTLLVLAQDADGPGAPALSAPKVPTRTLPLTPDRVETILVNNVQRVAIGNPEIADVTIVSSNELLIQAKRTGFTNLLIWDDKGKQEVLLTIGDSRPVQTAQELKRLLGDMQGMEDVKVDLQQDKVLLVGSVDTEQQLESLSTLVTGFSDALNLVTLNKEPKDLPPLVQLSVKVLELNRDDLQELGVDWSDSLRITEEEMSPASISDNLTRIGVSNSRTVLSWALQALVERNKARLLSEPRLVTISGKEASSFIGVEVPVLKATTVGVSSDSVSATIEYKQTGVILKMTPTVHTTHPSQQGKITTLLQAEVSDINNTVGLSVPVGNQTILVPGFQVRRTSTEVTTNSGETIFIAGLLDVNESEAVSQVPGLGDIPVLGRLFRTPQNTTERVELVITVTPEIVPDASKEGAYQAALQQAKAVSQVTASSSDPYVNYARQIQQKITSAITYPDREKSLKTSGTVRLRLRLQPNGSLDKIELSQPSGTEAFDLEAVKAAKSQAPYPGFPSGISEKELWLEVPVVFQP